MPSLLGVELARAGTWDLVTGGRRTFTVADFDDIVAASAEFGAATIRPGHTDPRFDGEPALGRVDNLRVVGDRLVGDLVDLPSWMASRRAAAAYPNRSIEGYSNVTSDTGRRYRMVLTSLALLGVTAPAIDGLAALPAAVAAAARRAGAEPFAAAAASMDLAEPSVDPDQDPGALAQAVDAILDEVQEALASGDTASAVALLTGAETTIDALLALLGVPDADDVPNGPVAPTSASRRRPTAIVEPTETGREGVANMDPAALRASIGLEATATDDEVTARLAELVARPEPTPEPTPETEPGPTAEAEPPAGAVVPPGFRLVADAVVEGWQSDIAESVAAARAFTSQQEDEFIRRNRSRIGAAGNPHATRTEDHLRREWQRNQGEAEAFAASLPERVPTSPAGHSGNAEDTGGEDEAIYAALFGAEKG